MYKTSLYSCVRQRRASYATMMHILVTLLAVGWSSSTSLAYSPRYHQATSLADNSVTRYSTQISTSTTTSNKLLPTTTSTSSSQAAKYLHKQKLNQGSLIHPNLQLISTSTNVPPSASDRFANFYDVSSQSPPTARLSTFGNTGHQQTTPISTTTITTTTMATTTTTHAPASTSSSLTVTNNASSDELDSLRDKDLAAKQSSLSLNMNESSKQLLQRARRKFSKQLQPPKASASFSISDEFVMPTTIAATTTTTTTKAKKLPSTSTLHQSTTQATSTSTTSSPWSSSTLAYLPDSSSPSSSSVSSTPTTTTTTTTTAAATAKTEPSVTQSTSGVANDAMQEAASTQAARQNTQTTLASSNNQLATSASSTFKTYSRPATKWLQFGARLKPIMSYASSSSLDNKQTANDEFKFEATTSSTVQLTPANNHQQLASNSLNVDLNANVSPSPLISSSSVGLGENVMSKQNDNNVDDDDDNDLDGESLLSRLMQQQSFLMSPMHNWASSSSSSSSGSEPAFDSQAQTLPISASFQPPASNQIAPTPIANANNKRRVIKLLKSYSHIHQVDDSGDQVRGGRVHSSAKPLLLRNNSMLWKQSTPARSTNAFNAPSASQMSLARGVPVLTRNTQHQQNLRQLVTPATQHLSPSRSATANNDNNNDDDDNDNDTNNNNNNDTDNDISNQQPNNDDNGLKDDAAIGAQLTSQNKALQPQVHSSSSRMVGFHNKANNEQQTGSTDNNEAPSSAANDPEHDADEDFECPNNGIFADKTSGCQAYHVCQSGAQVKSTFQCPLGTLFNDIILTCDFAHNVNCAGAAQRHLSSPKLENQAHRQQLERQIQVTRANRRNEENFARLQRQRQAQELDKSLRNNKLLAPSSQGATSGPRALVIGQQRESVAVQGRVQLPRASLRQHLHQQTQSQSHTQTPNQKPVPLVHLHSLPFNAPPSLTHFGRADDSMSSRYLSPATIDNNDQYDATNSLANSHLASIPLNSNIESSNNGNDSDDDEDDESFGKDVATAVAPVFATSQHQHQQPATRQLKTASQTGAMLVMDVNEPHSFGLVINHMPGAPQSSQPLRSLAAHSFTAPVLPALQVSPSLASGNSAILGTTHAKGQQQDSHPGTQQQTRASHLPTTPKPQVSVPVGQVKPKQALKQVNIMAQGQVQLQLPRINKQQQQASATNIMSNKKLTLISRATDKSSAARHFGDSSDPSTMVLLVRHPAPISALALVSSETSGTRTANANGSTSTLPTTTVPAKQQYQQATLIQRQSKRQL